MYRDYAEGLSNSVVNPESVLVWLSEGTKIQRIIDQSHALLQRIKILTSTITERMYTFLEHNSILPQEQKETGEKCFFTISRFKNTLIFAEFNSRKKTRNCEIFFPRKFLTIKYTF